MSLFDPDLCLRKGAFYLCLHSQAGFNTELYKECGRKTREAFKKASNTELGWLDRLSEGSLKEKVRVECLALVSAIGFFKYHQLLNSSTPML